MACDLEYWHLSWHSIFVNLLQEEIDYNIGQKYSLKTPK